jgi:hypothetical protein
VCIPIRRGQAMKKLSMLCAVTIIFGAGYATAQPNYQVDVAGDGGKSFVNEVDISVCNQETLDIYLADADAPQIAGGCWIDFSSSTADIVYVSAGRAFTDGSEGPTGPWDPRTGVLVNEPAGPGTLMYVVANLSGASPDGDGDLIIGSITLESVGSHDATVTITTIPAVDTWVPIDDASVASAALVIHQICGCMTDADCDDGIFCNGVEDCYEECCLCLPGTPPCDDGDPCTVNNCDGDTQTCNYDDCAATSQFDPCCNEPICDGASSCYCWGDFDCDEDVDAADIPIFLGDFGRSQYFNPCTNENDCNADFNCDGNVDADDLTKFLEDFGRSQFFNPCPACVGWRCVYP